MRRNEAYAYRRKIESAAAHLDDATALESIELFPQGESGRAVAEGERFQWNGALYKVTQPHTTQDGWTPDLIPALWTPVSLEEWPEWRQPTGAHDAYNKGDKMTYKGRRYISLIEGNVNSPEEYPDGWEAHA